MSHLKTIGIAAAISLFSTGSALAAAPQWTVDVPHSHVGFSVRHLVVSKVKGRFKNFTGTIVADKAGKISKLTGTVKTASVDTNEDRRDDHLRSNDFFDAAKYPLMKFDSTKITWRGNNLTVTGKLTIKGVTKTVNLQGEFLGKQSVDFGRGPQDHIGYSFETTINRRDFGLNFNRMANGILVVGDKVELELEMEAVKKNG